MTFTPIQCCDFINHGPTNLSCNTDNEDHTTYKVTYHIQSSTPVGPRAIKDLSGTLDLPQPGDIYAIVNLGEMDQWAWCTNEVEIEPKVEAEPPYHWLATYTFTSQLQDRCNGEHRTDPVLEAPRISGSFVKYTEEAVVDLYGKPILNSAHERMRGPQVEFDVSRPTIRIEKFFHDPNLELLNLYKDSVNDAPLWGLPARTIKLSNISFDKQFYSYCQDVWKVTLEFDINKNTWDRTILDEGTKVLHGKYNQQGEWELIDIDGAPPNPANPSHYDRFVDKQYNATTVILDGNGKPFNPVVAKTCACGPCSTGACAPTKWTVFGFPDFPLGIDITYTGGCTWLGSDLGSRDLLGVVSLEYTGSDWQVYNSLHPTDAWELEENSTFRCQGTNNFTNIAPDPAVPADPEYAAPDFLSIIPYLSDSKPGQIFVQKYPGRNFLALGVPTIL
jgi:hypothetical protein